MRLVHWISFLLALFTALLIAVVFVSQPAAQVSIPGLGSLPAYLVLSLVAATAFLAGWVYLPGYALVLSRERRARKKEKQALEAELKTLRSQQPEELPRIPDRPVPDAAEES